MNFYINNNKMFFLFTLIFSTFISISANSWMGCWIGLEINLLSFIPLISNPNNMISSEASMKYFLIQSIASINFLFIILLKMLMFININNFIIILMNSCLLMKMGSTPFHFWYPNIIEGLSWLNSFILMTWQKITPMILLSYCYNQEFMYFIIMLNSIIGAIGGINQTSLRKILTYSSINNLSWMMMSIMISNNLWMIFFSIYSLLNMLMCMMFYMFNSFYLNQLFFMNLNKMIKFSYFMNFMSLGSLPPLLGFFPKWMIINFMIENNFLILTYILILMSLITLFFYIRIFYSSILFHYSKMKWFKMNIKIKKFYMNFLIMFISITGIPLSTLFFI